MEISNNINSVILDIDKLTFKKEGVDNFLIHLQPSKENVTNTNVLKCTAPLESNDVYLPQLSGSDKSILTKISNIDTSFDKIDASLIELYNNGGGGGGSTGGGSTGGGSTFSGAATSLQFGSTNINLPSVIGTNGQTLLYNTSTGTFGWGEGGGSGGSNILTFGTIDKTLPTAIGGHDQILVYSALTGQLEWGDRTTGTGGGVDTTDFSLFIGKVDVSFSKVYEDIDRIDASINTRIDISLDEIKNSISNSTNNNYYSKTVLDSSFTDLSSVVHDISGNVQDISATLETFRVAANSNFTTIINELATTTDKFNDNNARFLTVNTNFNAFDDIITDICDNNLKPLIDNSNALLIGDTYIQLPSSQPGNDQILKYINNQLIWTNDTGGSGGGSTQNNTGISIIFNKDATESQGVTENLLKETFTNGDYIVTENSGLGNGTPFNATFEAMGPSVSDICNSTITIIAETTSMDSGGPPYTLSLAKRISDDLLYIFFHSSDDGNGNNILNENESYFITQYGNTNSGGGGGGATSQEVTDHMTATDASFAIVDASFVLADASFAAADASFVLADASFDKIDVSLINISNTFGNFDNIIVRIDQSLNTFKTSIASNLSSINSNYSTHISDHNTLSSTVTTLSNNVTQNSTYINDLTTAVNNRYTKIILDNSFADLSGVVYDLSDVVLSIKNASNNSINTINNIRLPDIDASLITIKSNIATIEEEIVKLDSSNIVLDASINELNTSVNGVVQSNANVNNAITNLNNKKHNYLDTQDNLPISMPAQRPTGKALIVSNDPSKFEWANIKEITKESDVNLLNLNVYGSTDVSGNIRVSDEIIVGMTDATENIRTKGSIKTNTATLHKITFPNNLNHAQRVIDISQQDIYHDVSGIHLTKTYLHDVDISGTVNILPTNSIITPLGVTIKFL